MSPPELRLEDQIAQWREYLRRRQAIHAVDVAELEDHLRAQIATLGDAGLEDDEAFLVAVKRLGNLDQLSREFAREHAERLWKQLVVTAQGADDAVARQREEAVVVFGLALLAGFLFKSLEWLSGVPLEEVTGLYARNLSLCVLPLLTVYFLWKRSSDVMTRVRLGVAFVAAVGFINTWPFGPGSDTEVLAILHLPIALWLLVGVAYAGGRWDTVAGRMDFVRFSGELFIYSVLIGLGGVLFGLTMLGLFAAIGVDVGRILSHWILPFGGLGAVLVAAWLVEAKQSVIENIAPVLTRLFTPLFALLLLAFLATLAWTGRGLDAQRELLIACDLLLALVLALLLYSLSARDPARAPDAFDLAQVVLVVSALLVDAVALWAIASRISEFGFTPNRVAALGENLILLANLAGAAWLYLGFLRGRVPFATLERWQTRFLPVYAGWAAGVVLLFPIVFG